MKKKKRKSKRRCSNLFFPSLQAGRILQIRQSGWFRERAVFYDLAR